MLNLQHVRDRLGAEFEPLTIHLTDGRHFLVLHRDFIAIGRGFVVIVDEANRSHKIDALHIVSIGDVNPEQGPNGS